MDRRFSEQTNVLRLMSIRGKLSQGTSRDRKVARVQLYNVKITLGAEPAQNHIITKITRLYYYARARDYAAL